MKLQLPGIIFRLAVFVQNPIPISLLKKKEPKKSWAILKKYWLYKGQKGKKNITYPLFPLSIISTSK